MEKKILNILFCALSFYAGYIFSQRIIKLQSDLIIYIEEDNLDYELEDEDLEYEPSDLKYLPQEIQEQLECGISGSFFKNPLITPYGHTFEKKSIIEWLKQKKECPFTKQPLTIKDLRVNINIRKAIEYFIQHKNE